MFLVEYLIWVNVQVLDMEKQVLKSLNYEMGAPTTINFLRQVFFLKAGSRLLHLMNSFSLSHV
jgi:cyclin A